MKIITFLLALGLLAAAHAQNQPILGEDTVKVSDHVWAIMGFPNIGVVVGGNATLVVDTALGPAMAPRSRRWRKNSHPRTSCILFNDDALSSGACSGRAWRARRARLSGRHHPDP
ncbi:MAG: hypothetical protein DMG57_11055 [Acidobacteria bacterium]|nr:MAG: hypothetical protein DMG57_11055 [Acidobacteriota bacterium]